jgi:ectoine hydroxylase
MSTEIGIPVQLRNRNRPLTFRWPGNAGNSDDLGSYVNLFWNDGYFKLPENMCLGVDEARALRAYCNRFMHIDSPYRLFDDKGQVHSIYLDPEDPVFESLSRLPRFLKLVSAILGQSTYIHQLKLNPKSAGGGKGYIWHRDSGFWRELDHLPSEEAINIAILLDDVGVDMEAGPLLLAPGTHRTAATGSGGLGQAWVSTENQGLSKVVGELSQNEPTPSRTDAFHGPAGSAIVFHSHIVHGSMVNLSGNPRWILYITYNQISNRPHPCPSPRPPLIAGRNFEPLLPVAEDAFTIALSRVP